MKRIVVTLAIMSCLALSSFTDTTYTVDSAYRKVQELVYFSGCNGCQAGIDRANAWLHQQGFGRDVYTYWNAYNDPRIDRDEELQNLEAVIDWVDDTP